MTEKTIDMFAGYRKNYSAPHPAGQLILPENLKEFGLYMLGLIKSRAFKGKHGEGLSRPSTSHSTTPFSLLPMDSVVGTLSSFTLNGLD